MDVFEPDQQTAHRNYIRLLADGVLDEHEDTVITTVEIKAYVTDWYGLDHVLPASKLEELCEEIRVEIGSRVTVSKRIR